MSSTLLLQTFALTGAGLKVRYRETWIGFLWVMFNPLVLLLAQGFIFSYIFKISILNYLFYFASGLLPWFFFSQTLEMGTSHLRSHSRSIKSYFVKPIVFIISLSLENLITLFASTLIIMLPLCLYENKPLWIPFFWLLNSFPLFLSAVSLTLITSCSQVVYRDTRFIVSFVLSVAYFLTPIFYKISFLPTSIKKIIVWNPFHILLSPFQVLSENTDLTLWSIAFIKALSLSIILLFLSRVYWTRIKNTFYLRL